MYQTSRKAVADAVTALFTAGNGKRATRLVLVAEEPGKPTVDLGGWAETAMTQQLCRLLGIGEPRRIAKRKPL